MSESESTRKDFPNWENLYKSQSVETMPWYNERFDSDLERELDQRDPLIENKVTNDDRFVRYNWKIDNFV